MNLIDRDKLIEGLEYYRDNSCEPEHYNFVIDSIVNVQPTVSEWIPISERLPKEETQYLCAMKKFIGDELYFVVRRFAKDLYRVDEFDFAHKKGVSGFYSYDSEYGFMTADVIAWMPIPTYEVSND